MDAVLRALVIYAFIVVVMRLSGKRTMSQLTAVDFVLLLIISEATQQALLGDDFSLTTSALVITALVFIDRFVDFMKFRFKGVSKVVEGTPLVVVEHGKPLTHRLRKEHIDVDDVLAAARANHGLHRIDQIDYAILETSGGISVIPNTAG